MARVALEEKTKEIVWDPGDGLHFEITFTPIPRRFVYYQLTEEPKCQEQNLKPKPKNSAGSPG